MKSVNRETIVKQQLEIKKLFSPRASIPFPLQEINKQSVLQQRTSGKGILN